MSEDSKIIITIMGGDKMGLVAEFSGLLAKYQVNIEDIRQAIIQEYFTMIMMADTSKITISFQKLKEELLDLGNKMGMEVWVQKKTIFDKMHHI